TCSKSRLRSSSSLGSWNPKTPSLLRSSTVFLTAAFTSSSVNSLEGPFAAGAAVSPAGGAACADWSLARKNSRAFWIFSSGFLRNACFERAVQFTEQSVLTSWPAAKPMAHSLLNSPLAGDALGGGWSPAVAGADTAKNNAAAAAVARATEAKPRQDLLYFMT